MRPPELSSSHSRYCVALATAFHVNVGVDVAMLPAGATSVAAPGGGVPAAAEATEALPRPLPDALPVTIHHWPAPGVSTTGSVSEHVPVPLAQPASVAVYHCRRRPPELSSSHSRYCVAPATAFQVYVGDRKSTRLNSSHGYISYAVFCLKKKKKTLYQHPMSRGKKLDVSSKATKLRQRKLATPQYQEKEALQVQLSLLLAAASTPKHASH